MKRTLRIRDRTPDTKNLAVKLLPYIVWLLLIFILSQVGISQALAGGPNMPVAD